MAGAINQAKSMTSLLNEETRLPAFDTSAIPKKLLSVLDVEKVSQLKLVKVDPLAVLKIVKHARESQPTPANGQLLGLEVNGVLEITNAFAVPSLQGSEEDMADYQVEMIQFLREVNIDSNSVGWYQSTRLGDFMQQPMLEIQAGYEAPGSSNGSSVVLIHDTSKTEQAGNLSLRAFRLSQTYLEMAKSSKFTTKDLAAKGLTYGNILEELPIQIETSGLAKALLSELQWPANAEQDVLESLQRPSSFNAKLRARRLADRSAISDDTDASDALDNSLSGLLPSRPTAYLSRPMCPSSLELGQGLTGSGTLLRQLEAIGDLIDEHIHDANQWMYWKRGEAKENNRKQQFVQRRATSNAARIARGEQPEPELSQKELDKMFKTQPEPSRINALLNIANLNLITKGVTQSRGTALTKMYMAQGLQETSE
ncbi:hypothetical protein GGI07_004319 [Coemansia sp. Benny D115]|nr:hypothetical protein GGI07_004319 [Coemansia sp. Benny D115]